MHAHRHTQQKKNTKKEQAHTLFFSLFRHSKFNKSRNYRSIAQRAQQLAAFPSLLSTRVKLRETSVDPTPPLGTKYRRFWNPAPLLTRMPGTDLKDPLTLSKTGIGQNGSWKAFPGGPLWGFKDMGVLMRTKLWVFLATSGCEVVFVGSM